MSKSFAERINDAQVMFTGMKANQEEAGERGWTEEKNSQLAVTRKEAVRLNDEQEKLKADLKTKTAQLNEKMAKLNAEMKEAKKVVKLGFPQSRWKEFGVTDKR